MMAPLKQTANDLNLPFGDRKMTYNSRLAQELGKWAESEGKGDEFHASVFHAYFVDGKNIAKASVLAETAVSVNLNGEAALKIIRDRTYKKTVDQDWERSYELRVRAVPTFVFNRQSLVGAQKYDALKQLVMSHLHFS